MENIEDIYELSPLQQGILFHTLYDPHLRVYFQQFSFTLNGTVNPLGFKQAWQEVILRHPALRTAFYWEDLDKPVQVVYPDVELPWQEFDWRTLNQEQQKAQFQQFLHSDQKQGFALDQVPLMRCTLIRLAHETYEFVWSHHHLLIDGWSLGIIFQEVLRFYEAFCQGKNLDLELPPPYRDYILWLQAQDPLKAEPFWREAMQGFTAPTSLAIDKSIFKEASSSQSYQQQQLHLSAPLTTELRAFAQQHRLTLNTLVQGAYALLLSRYSQESDLVFGATVSGRPPSLTGVESMVGLFINTLPVRVNLSENLQLLDWLQQLQTQQVVREQYADTSLIDIQGWSEIPRGKPLFDSIIVFENYPLDPSLWQDKDHLIVSNIQIFEQTNYPLTLTILLGENLTFKINYDCQRFESDAIARMLGHLKTLLEEMISAPHKQLGQLSLLGAAEKAQIFGEWNNTKIDYHCEQSIPELFSEQVEKTPDAVAVIFENQHLTYKQLNEKASQLAHYLQQLGVTPETLVGLCMERSLWMIIGIWGILKAGGAYIPLEPSYPLERLSDMLEDSKVSILLTQEKLINQLPQYQGQVIALDKDWPQIATYSTENLDSLANLDHLIYVIYTSGSTGKPKGVMNIHRALVNRLLWMQQTYPLTAADRVLQKTPFSFDVSVWEFFWPLLTGATLVIAKPGGHQDSHYLVNLISQQQITTVHFVPSMLQVFLEEKGLKDCHSLKRVICSGEALPFSLQKRFFERLNCELHNLYGPTEAAIDVTFYHCQPDSDLNLVPIGRPVANTQIYILDQSGQPLPIGVPGELHLGGVQLARGYLNRPQLTAEKFIPNPFNPTDSQRLYKTGDLGKYLPDGNIEYLRRLDHQVKIRGFRIELEEIEAVLGQHPNIRENIVINFEDESGNKRLVAYIVSDLFPAKLPDEPEFCLELDEQTFQLQKATLITNVRNFLQQKLPDYMIPNAFVWLDSLPLTPNGKVDRRALPDPDFSGNNLVQTFVAPRTSTEQTLAIIWTEVLNIKQVSIDDNFFNLGGHSLLATQVISRLREALQMDLSVRILFEAPTLVGLAERIEKIRLTVEQLQNPLISLGEEIEEIEL